MLRWISSALEMHSLNALCILFLACSSSSNFLCLLIEYSSNLILFLTYSLCSRKILFELVPLLSISILCFSIIASYYWISFIWIYSIPDNMLSCSSTLFYKLTSSCLSAIDSSSFILTLLRVWGFCLFDIISRTLFKV